MRIVSLIIVQKKGRNSWPWGAVELRALVYDGCVICALCVTFSNALSSCLMFLVPPERAFFSFPPTQQALLVHVSAIGNGVCARMCTLSSSWFWASCADYPCRRLFWVRWRLLFSKTEMWVCSAQDCVRYKVANLHMKLTSFSQLQRNSRNVFKIYYGQGDSCENTRKREMDQMDRERGRTGRREKRREGRIIES